MAEVEKTPLEQAKMEPEDPKEIAKQMLRDSYDDPNIVDEIVEVTGLGKRTIWALKGALARSGDIPTKAELAKIPKPGPEEQRFIEEREGVPFRRPRPPHVILERVLNEFGVKDRVKTIIVNRAKRAGAMHPIELQRMLMDLESGQSRKEAGYLADEYYFALQSEEQRAREYEGRAYAMRRGEPTYAGPYPTTGARRESPTTTYGQRQYGYESRPWERGGRGDERPLTMRDITEILRDERRTWEEQRRKETIEGKLSEVSSDIGQLAQEIINLKENPPVVTPPGETDYEKTLKHTIDRQDQRVGELIGQIREERNESREILREVRDTYDKRMDNLREELKEAERKAGRPSTEGYRSDEIRLAADAMNRVGDILERRESPVKIIVQGMREIAGGEGEQPPPRERGKPSSVADLVGPDYVERP